MLMEYNWVSDQTPWHLSGQCLRQPLPLPQGRYLRGGHVTLVSPAAVHAHQPGIFKYNMLRYKPIRNTLWNWIESFRASSISGFSYLFMHAFKKRSWTVLWLRACPHSFQKRILVVAQWLEVQSLEECFWNVRSIRLFRDKWSTITWTSKELVLKE